MFQTSEQTKNTVSLSSILLLIFGWITVAALINEPGNQFAYVYQTIWLVTTIGFLLAISNVKHFEFLGPNKNTFGTATLIGLILGIFLVGGTLFNGLGFSFALPQLNSLVVPFAVTGILSFYTITTVFLFGTFVPKVEEGFMSGFVQPTVQEWLSRPGIRESIFFFAGVLFYFFIPNSPFKILSYIVGGIGAADLFIVSLFLGKNKGILQFIFQIIPGAAFWLSLIFKGVFFAVLHYYAAVSTGQDPTLYMISAFIFAIIAGIANKTTNSTVAGEVAHAINNTVLMLSVLGLSLWWFFILIPIDILIIATTAGAGLKDIFKINLQTLANPQLN